MTREEFIQVLKKHAETAGVFGNRFVCRSVDENHWNYHRPAVDAPEPSIDLTTEGFVLYNSNIGFVESTIEKISYEDFITRLKFNK